jgi:hypothetical protein
MDQFAATIETLEHRWMRAWVQRDKKQMKALASRDFIFLLGSTKAAILDRPSWLEAASARFTCDSYRFDEVYVRKHGATAVFACQATLQANMGAIDWSGPVWITDLWQRSRITRNWRLVERLVSRPDSDADISRAVREMQLWR